MVCPNCGTPLPEDARFCPNCGTPVSEPAVQERKLVTVVFADLAGSTELATHLDPERYREVMQAFYQMVSRELASLRGRAEKFVGDAVMAVFGLPHAHEDDALRAVRAGLIIRDRTARLGEMLGLPLELGVRVGVNSGSVAIGPGGGDQALVVGPAVNLAARLQQAAAPGEVLAGETTWQLTWTQVAFGEPRKIEAKGFEEEVVAHPVAGLAPRSARRAIPIVGRERELSLLADTFRRAQDTRRAHLFTILGEPGIGKSRLGEEFLATLDDGVKVLTGTAGRYEEESALAPIAEMIRREIGIEADTPPDVVRTKLHDVVEGCCDPSETEQTAARLGIVLGIDEESRENRPYRIAEVRAGFLALLEGLSRGGPVVLLFEDLHLGAEGLLELVEQVVRQARGIPLFVLALAREELLEAAVSWGGGILDAVTLRLEALSEQEALDLALSAADSIDRTNAERIARAAGGNPFFIVEATGMHADAGGWDPLTAPHSHPIPPTVEAVIASRIDHLPSEAREVLRKASVFARSRFQESELELIAEQDGAVLDLLEREELLLRDPDRDGVWRFRHEMVRDVAYGSLAKRDRLQLHVTLADELEKREGDRYVFAVAYHLEQAAHASLDLAPADRSLADRAVDALSKAGDRARRGIESRQAVDEYERALALAGPEASWGSREAWILSGLGEARYWLGEFEAAAASLERALELEHDNAWTLAHAARFLGDIELSARGNRDRARELFDRALAAAREIDDPWVVARVLLMSGWEPYWREDYAGAEAVFREALEIARANPEGDRWAEARALTFLASMRSGETDEQEVLALGEEALAVGRELGDPFTVAVALERVGTSLRRMMRLEEAFAALDEAVRIFEDLGARWELASVLGERGTVRRLRGQLEDSERDLRTALGILRDLKDRTLVAWIVHELVEVLLDRGDKESARRLVAETESELPADEPGSRTIPLRLDALLALADGDTDRALQRSLEILDLRRRTPNPNMVAAEMWFIGRTFGAEHVGGEDALKEARRRLEEVQWQHSIDFPDLVRARSQTG